MSNQKIKVLLTIQCRNMGQAKLQRYKFDQTLGTSNWLLQENLEAIIHPNETVTTTTIWGRVFGDRNDDQRINKKVTNLIKRAAEHASIEDIDYHWKSEIIFGSKIIFDQPHVLTSED